MERRHQVTETWVERGYHPEEEAQQHVAAELVILQSPESWFSAPWIYKKYVGEVINAGLATKVFLEGDHRTREDPRRQYGTGGRMQGRRFMFYATWNAPRDTFDNPDGVLYGGKGTADLVLHITSNDRLIGFGILPDFGVFDIFMSPHIPHTERTFVPVAPTKTATSCFGPNRIVVARLLLCRPSRGCACVLLA